MDPKSRHQDSRWPEPSKRPSAQSHSPACRRWFVGRRPPPHRCRWRLRYRLSQVPAASWPSLVVAMFALSTKSALSVLVNCLNGVSSRRLRQRHPTQVRKLFVGQALLVPVLLRRLLRRRITDHHQAVHRPAGTPRLTRPAPRADRPDRLPRGRKRPGFRRRRIGEVGRTVVDEEEHRSDLFVVRAGQSPAGGQVLQHVIELPGSCAGGEVCTVHDVVQLALV
jgi:hypothetical protein